MPWTRARLEQLSRLNSHLLCRFRCNYPNQLSFKSPYFVRNAGQMTIFLILIRALSILLIIMHDFHS